jgi:hypothetical protein
MSLCVPTLAVDRVVPLSRSFVLKFIDEIQTVKTGHDMEKVILAYGLDATVDHAFQVANRNDKGLPAPGNFFGPESFNDFFIVIARFRASYQGRLHELLQGGETRILSYARKYALKVCGPGQFVV